MPGDATESAVERWFLPILTAAVAARVLLLLFAPPLLDICFYNEQAAGAVLSGLDPYGFSYTGIPAWLATPGAENVFAYLPGVLYFLVPFGAVGEAGLGLVLADVLVVVGLKGLGGRRGAAAAAIFLLIPFAVLFSTVYPNNSLPAMAFLAGFFLLERRGRGTWGAALLGAAFASSQLVWLIAPFAVLLYARGRRWKDLAVSLVVAALVVLPFFLWDPSTFVYDTVLFQFARTARPIVSPAAFGLNVNPTLSGVAATFGLAIPSWIRGLATAALLVFFLARTRGLPSAVYNSGIFLTAAVLVLPTDLSWWYLEIPFQLLLTWLVLAPSAEDRHLGFPGR